MIVTKNRKREDSRDRIGKERHEDRFSALWNEKWEFVAFNFEAVSTLRQGVIHRGARTALEPSFHHDQI